jgi:tetratricopeptide (TPR) repeat protein
MTGEVTSIRLRRMMVVLSWLLLSGSSGANESNNWTDDDFALYPAYCRVKLTGESAQEVEYWKKYFGFDNYIHMHHYCFGLKAMTLAYANFGDRKRRSAFALDVIRNMNYILNATRKDFFMRPDALINLGRGYLLMSEGDKARKAFEDALKLRPDSVDAWVALSDLYHDAGQRKQALAVLEEALKRTGDHPKISLRMEELKKTGGR